MISPILPVSSYGIASLQFIAKIPTKHQMFTKRTVPWLLVVYFDIENKTQIGLAIFKETIEGTSASAWSY